MVYRYISAHFEHWAEINMKLSIFDGGNKIDYYQSRKEYNIKYF
jgi:hypothetical protein